MFGKSYGHHSGWLQVVKHYIGDLSELGAFVSDILFDVQNCLDVGLHRGIQSH
jgi:hypothetical protein